MTEISFETAVARILRRHGAAVMDDPIRFRNLLRDHCTSEQCRREINVTLLCTRSGLLAQIFASDTSLPSDVQLGRYAAILHEEYGIDESFARTVVQIWLDGLAIAQEHDETVRKGWKPNGIQEIGESWTIPDLGMVLMPVDSGSFQMGSEDEYGGQKPARVVQITRPYWIGKTEVTQAEYRNITGESPSFFYGDDLPVEGVNWDDAVAFCDELTRREHTAGRLPQGYVYRLPTEAEWEYAARGGNKSKGYTYSGGNFINEVAWYSGNSENMPHPVGLKMPNELGICDMGGNIAEWCADWQQNSYRGIPDSDVKRLATGPYRVFRGGGWHHGAWCCRPVERNGLEPSSACAFLGFRVVLAPVLDFGVETTSRNLPSSADTKPPHDTKEDISGVNAGDGISSHRPAPEHPWTIPDLGMMLMPVAAGSFQMGSEVGENYEKPVRTVRISHDFWVGKTQVTQAEYRKVTGESPSFFHGDDLPVEKVSWGDAEAFCEKLTNCEREAGRLPQGYVYRLPTEAEWEYAAKGGNKSKGFTYSGGNDIDAVAWYYGNAGKTRLDDSSWSVDKLMENGNCTHPVGQKTANELGLHDMSGNVCEWCSDWFQESYSGLPVADPEGPTIGMHRVYRGGCSDSSPAECLSTTRHWCSPSETPAFFGLRIVLAPALNNVDVETTKRPRNEPIAARPWTIPDLGMVMIPVEAGSFAMGEENGFFNAKPIRTVRITRDFWVGKMEVTQAEYRKVTSESPSDFHGDDLPVEKVSWGAAEAFCDGLTRRERMARRLPQGYVYRLPTEAEWEYAAKGGTKSKGFIYAGGNNIDEVAWHRKNSNKALPGFACDFHCMIGSMSRFPR